MKKNTTTKKAKPATPQLASFTPCLTLADITAAWVNKQAKGRQLDENSCLKEFATIANMVCQNYKTFSQSDFLSLTRGLDLDPSEVLPLLDSWAEELTRNGRLDCSNWCGWPQFTFK